MNNAKRHLPVFRLSLFLCVLLALALACSDDEQGQKETPPVTTGSDTRREILLTLDNKLKVKSKASAVAKAAGPEATATPANAPETKAAGAPAETKVAETKATDLIATDAENEIATLDIYVFGAEKEDDVFTFQELLYYRYDGTTIDQPWAKSFELLQKNENQTNGLLEIQKGLFVKLYVVANHPGLVGSIDGAEAVGDLPYAKFKSLTMNGKGIEKRSIATMGVPAEDRFITFRTPLLNPSEEDDVIRTPLPMVGSLLTPLDLTDFEVNTRLQAGFKLSRIVSRFDIVNDAESSRFTLKSVSMGEGRSGVSYFPIKPYEAAPPLDDARIEYFPRAFTGAQTKDDKLTTGAFYSYPSPKDDKAYLILNGTYAVNRTERKEVTYRVPFKREVADGTGNYIEIAYNHRYTLYISDADEYHLDVDIRVADWDEGGSIDDYQPDTGLDSLRVTIEEANGVFDPGVRTVSLLINPKNYFYVSTASNSGVTVKRSYDNGTMENDWLLVEEEAEATKRAADAGTGTDVDASFAGTRSCRFKVNRNPDYKGMVFPRARLVFEDNASSREEYIYVRPFGMPEVYALAKSPGDTNPNFFVDSTLVLTMYRALGSTLPLQVTCPDGCVVKDVPKGVEVKKNESLSSGAEWIYDITIRDTTGLAGSDTLRFAFANGVENKFAAEVSLAVRDAGIDASWTTGDANTWNKDQTELTMPLIAGNKFQLSTRSISGVKVAMDFKGGPSWLRHNGETFLRAGSVPNALVFTLNEDHLVGAGPVDVTITNNYQGDPYKFKVIPVAQEPVLPASLTSSVPGGSGNAWTLSSKTLEVYKYSSSASDAVIQVLTPGGCDVVNPYAWLTIVKDSVDYQTNRFTFRLAKDAKPPVDKGTYKVTLRNMTDTTNKKAEITVVPRYDVPTMAQKSVSHASLNSYTENASGGVLTLYKSPTGTSWVNVTATSKGGSTFSNLPAWLTVSPANISGSTSGDYALTLDNGKVGTATTAEMRVCNLSDPTNTFKKVTVKVMSSDITAVYTNVANTSGTLPNINMSSASASFKLRVTSVAGFQAGVEYASGSSKWLTLSPLTTQSKGTVDVTVSFNPAAVANAKAATVRLTNKFSGGNDYTLTVTPIVVSASDLTVNAQNNLQGNIPVTSTTGVTAAVLNNNWNGGGQWFDITTNSVNGGTNQNIVIKQKADLSNVIMKPVTVRLTSKVGDVVKDVTVTPQNFAAPKLSATSGTDNDYYLNTTNSLTFTTTTVGGWANATTSNANVATVERADNKYTVTSKGVGTATITVPNGSDGTKTSTYKITISATKTYNGKPVWKYYGYYIAPEDAGSTTWNTSLNATYCANKSGATWFVPSAADWRLILGGTSGDADASSGVFNEYKSKGVFVSGSNYWSTTEFNSSNAYSLYFYSSYAYVGSYTKSYSRQVRCVSK